jgi:hypothetical protein
MDLNVQAFRIVNQATEESTSADKRTQEALRRGGIAGAAAWLKTTSPERRREIAIQANAVRWNKGRVKAQQ